QPMEKRADRISYRKNSSRKRPLNQLVPRYQRWRERSCKENSSQENSAAVQRGHLLYKICRHNGHGLSRRLKVRSVELSTTLFRREYPSSLTLWPDQMRKLGCSVSCIGK